MLILQAELVQSPAPPTRWPKTKAAEILTHRREAAMNPHRSTGDEIGRRGESDRGACAWWRSGCARSQSPFCSFDSLRRDRSPSGGLGANFAADTAHHRENDDGGRRRRARWQLYE